MHKRILNIRGQQPTPRPKRVYTGSVTALNTPVWQTYNSNIHDFVYLRPYTDAELDDFFARYFTRALASRVRFMDIINKGQAFDNYGPAISAGDEHMFMVSHVTLRRDQSYDGSSWLVPREAIIRFENSEYD